MVALREVAGAPPDGRTLGWVSTPALPARSIDRRGAERLLDMLTLVGAVAKEPIAVVSPSDGPLASIHQLLSRSGEDFDDVPLGTPPPGSAPHLAALRVQELSGTKLNIVAFPSAAAARQAALSGNLAAAFLALGDAGDLLRTGRLIGLGIAARRRLDSFPDLSPLQEAGLALSAVILRGIAGAGGAAGRHNGAARGRDAGRRERPRVRGTGRPERILAQLCCRPTLARSRGGRPRCAGSVMECKLLARRRFGMRIPMANSRLFCIALGAALRYRRDHHAASNAALVAESAPR